MLKFCEFVNFRKTYLYIFTAVFSYKAFCDPIILSRGNTYIYIFLETCHSLKLKKHKPNAKVAIETDILKINKII